MNKNFIALNKWIDFEYKVNNNFITDQIIQLALTELFNKFSHLSKDNFILIQFKIINLSLEYRSISKVQTIKLSELNKLIDIFIECWHLNSKNYHSINGASIVFTYKLLDLNTENNGNNLINSGLFLFFRNINNKIPLWLKIIFKLIFIFIIIIKIIGLPAAITIINSNYYLKLWAYLGCLGGIIYQLVHIFFIYFFSIKKRKIPEILPDPLINWLKEFEIICETKIGIKEFKNLYYREILVYVIMIIFVTIIF